MAFEIEGKLYKKFETENKTETFKAREFILLIEEGNYPQYIKFQLTQDRCNLIDKFNEGDTIKVSFDLRGREWNEKFFTNLNAWRIEGVQSGNNEGEMPFEDAPPMPNDEDLPDELDFDNHAGDVKDDLPF